MSKARGVFPSLWVISIVAFPALAAPTYYTPQSVAAKVQAGEVFHPQETPRAETFFKDLAKAGRNISCASRLWLAANGSPSKVFHQKILGSGLIELELDPDRATGIRHGLFADGGPQKIRGVMSLTRGRGDASPLQGVPDVLGMSLGLDVGGKWVALTMTASQGAFGKTHLEFSDLAGFSGRAGLAGRWLTGLLPEILQHYAGKLAGMGGEGLFAVRHPKTGLFVLLPGTLNGGLVRASPFLGHGDIGFGSGHAYLLDEAAPVNERRAFKFSVKLVETGLAQTIQAERTGFLNKLLAIGRGLDPNYLSKDFDHWTRQGDIEFDLFVQVDDPKAPETTPIEDPRWAWPTEPLRVGRIRLLAQRPVTQTGNGPIVDVNLARDVTTFCDQMSFNPGF
ncbi:hypothetical protein K2X33_15145, partial [bacterium]|nr:hypothetical protein [bacterium]